MKCTNPLKCDGEMKSYEGLPSNLVECIKCGYRMEGGVTSKGKTAPAPTITKETVLPKENKGENK